MIREILYSIVTESSVSAKLVQVIRTYLNYTYSRVQESRHLSDVFTVQSWRCLVADDFLNSFRRR